MTEVIVELANGVGELILNRPKQRNALTGPLVMALNEGVAELLANPECRVIIVRGSEGFFCAGLDLKAFSATPAPEWKADFQSLWATYHQQIYLADIPVIGALEGFAIAGGSSLALACDFLVAGETSFMHVSEVERNMLAPLNVFWLTHRHGYQKSLRMGLIGERWKSPDLVSHGLVEKCVPDGEVVAAAHEMATRFASFESENVRGLKRSIRAASFGLSNGETFKNALEQIKNAASKN